jgi:tripeptide aminopeptidase
MRERLLEKFIRYARVDTESDAKSETFPSTEKQMDLANILLGECADVGLEECELNKYGYVTATLPSNLEGGKTAPIVAFFAHMDTSQAYSGKDVKPQIIKDYDGSNIELLNGISITTKDFPELAQYKGKTLITADGTTLLGADDKAGIAEILTAMEFLIANPDIKHGDIKICFNPDEEVGRGMKYFDVAKFGADFAFTLDGGELGEFEYENFNAAQANIEIEGKSVHPGTAKGVMVNSILLGAELINALPKNETPEATEKYEGFYLVNSFNGSVAKTSIEINIRDFFNDSFAARKKFIQDLTIDLNKQYDGRIKLDLKDSYFNMREAMEKRPEVLEIAKKAYLAAGVEINIKPIRGGTDGARLSLMGLPTPNIFAGGHNFHGPYEYICVESMLKAAEIIIKICEIAAA